jgi:hypothetical protein
MRKIFAVVLLSLTFAAISPTTHARTVSGVDVPERASVKGTTLVLNGAGMRVKFFFDIYVCGLYLPKAAHDTKSVLAQTGPRRVLMHFVYKKVGRDKLVDAWNEGFADNSSKAELAGLRKRIDAFNDLFETVSRGDIVLLDYEPDIGTRVSINGKDKGTIAGKDFNDALLRIWLGKEPVTNSLKREMLGK